MKLPVVDLSAQEIDESVRSDVISLRLLMTVTAFGVVAFVNSGDVTAKAMLGLAPGTAISDPGIDLKIELSTQSENHCGVTRSKCGANRLQVERKMKPGVDFGVVIEFTAVNVASRAEQAEHI